MRVAALPSACFGGAVESSLFAETPAQFFMKIRPWTLTFAQQGSQVTRIDILDGGEIVSGRKID